MRIYLLAFFVFIFAFHIHAQKADNTAYFEIDTLHVDTPPQFDGGLTAFTQFLITHVQMPDNGINGTAYFEFIIEKDGSLTNVRILKSVSPAHDKALIDAISQSPHWKPGYKKGIPVRVRTAASLNMNKPGGGTVTESNDSMGVFSYVSVMPSFQGGGESAFTEYIKTNLIYPKDAKALRIQGTVYVQYIIERDGSVTNVSIVPGRGVYYSLDQAAMDVIKSSPKWTPGSTNGKPVRVKKIQRISFILTK